MDKVIKQKWVEALRSGKYQQTTKVLKSQDDGECRYCCLGVLCDVVDNTGWLPNTDYVYKDEKEDVQLPKKLKKELDISDAEETQLVCMNDDYGRPFGVIADWIEKNL